MRRRATSGRRKTSSGSGTGCSRLGRPPGHVHNHRAGGVIPRPAEVRAHAERDGARAATTDNELARARRCLQWAVEQKLLPYNPLARVHLERKNNTRKSKIRTEEELQRLLALADPVMKALILAQIDCGFRRMEVFSLQWRKSSSCRTGASGG